MTDQVEKFSVQLKRRFSVASLTTTGSFLSESNRTSNSSSVGTIVGPGSLAGKAIYRLGKITLKGVEQVAIYRRLSAIYSHFPHLDSSFVNGIEQMYLDLLELSRPKMYSNGIRIQALGMILAQIGSRNIKHLLNALTRFPVIEIGMLVADIVPHFDPVTLTFLSTEDATKNPVLKTYTQSLPEREENSFAPLVDFLSEVASLDERRCDVVLANGTLDLLLGFYVNNFQDVLAPKLLPARRPMRSSVLGATSLLGACNSLFMDAFIKGYGSELINMHPVSTLWPFHPAIEFLHDTESRRSKRKLYWDLASRDYVVRRMTVLRDMMLGPSGLGVFDVDALLDAFTDCLTFVVSVDEEVSYRGLRTLYTAISSGNNPLASGTLLYDYLSNVVGLDMASTLKRIVDMLSCLLSPTSRAVDLFRLPDDPSDLIADALRVFINNLFASMASRNEEYHNLISGTGIIQIARETLTLLENTKLENEKPVAISELFIGNEDLDLYSSVYTTSADQPYPVHAVRWNLIILERRIPGRRLRLLRRAKSRKRS
ncbi:hypothetical protein L218DRAFT_962170 [Marasmius fiardii PR-910]|nr:hypothetical protein L218DRAFT_962170 [Marasmius fiardii PR-910]